MAALYLNLLTVNSFFFLSGLCTRESHLSITASKMMEALSGSCLQIPCSFTPRDGQEKFDERREIYGVWIKSSDRFSNNPSNIVFNRSKSVNLYEISLIGNLTQKNCTTVFNNLHKNHTNKYFFRIENGPFKATAAWNPIQITVQDSAWSPSIEIPADLKEEESVTVTCSALTPCPQSPPELTWNLQADSQRHIEENTNGSFITKIQKNITLSDSDDGFTINCSVRYPVNKGENVKTAETQQTLSVSYSPKNTSVSISPSGLVSVGSWVNLTCSSRAKPPVSSFSWFRISKDGDIKVADGDFYSFNVTENAEYRCTATNRIGNQTSEVITLRIKGPSDGSLPWEAILGGGVVLICLIICSLALLCWRRKNSTNSTVQQNQAQTSESLSIEPESTKEENIHYGEIKFTKKASTSSAQTNGGEVDAIYAPVEV